MHTPIQTKITEIKEAVELPLTHPELYEDIGIKPPKVIAGLFIVWFVVFFGGGGGVGCYWRVEKLPPLNSHITPPKKTTTTTARASSCTASPAPARPYLPRPSPTARARPSCASSAPSSSRNI